MSRDPIGERGGMNVFEAMGNNTIAWVDPSGLEWSNPERTGGRRARTTCETCDTVRELAEKIHLDPEEFTNWLQTEPLGGELPTNADQPIGSQKTFTIPNTVYITYGNMRAAYNAGTLIADPTDLSFVDKNLARASGMENTFSSKGYKVYNMKYNLDVGGNPMQLHRSVLANADTAVWGFFGHGKTPDGVFLADDGSPGGQLIGGFSTAYKPSFFRGTQGHRLSEIVLYSCFQGSPALLPGWLDMVAVHGTVVASPLAVSLGSGGWSMFYHSGVYDNKRER